LIKLEETQIEFEAAGGYTVDQKIANVLKGLGFLEEDYERYCAEFSGGWQMRIALARLLLSEPDVLILDEVSQNLIKTLFMSKRSHYQSFFSLPITWTRVPESGWVNIWQNMTAHCWW